MRPNLVWYASYGSNLCYERRFMCYLRGGTPAGSRERNPGCRDPTPPRDMKPVLLPFELYFASYAKSWDGAPAFIRPGNDKHRAYGRMYLITDEQFNDVVLQENGRKPNGKRFVPSFEELNGIHEFRLPSNPLYGLLLRVDTQNGAPIITFTTARNLISGPPSEAYVKIIVAGLRETNPAMTDAEIAHYLLDAEGVRDRIPSARLFRWMAQA